MKLSLPRRRAVRDPGAPSPQLSTYQPRWPITADRGKPQGGDSTLTFVFKGRPRSRSMRHWRRRPARLERFLRNIKPVLPFVSRPSRWQYARLPHPTHVAFKGASGIARPWETRHGRSTGLLVGGAAPPGHRSNNWRTQVEISNGIRIVSTFLSEPTDSFSPRPTAGRQPAARRSWLCVGCRSCHPTMTRPPMSPRAHQPQREVESG